MNRRSFLRFLAIAPVGVPMVAAGVAQSNSPALIPSVWTHGVMSEKLLEPEIHTLKFKIDLGDFPERMRSMEEAAALFDQQPLSVDEQLIEHGIVEMPQTDSVSFARSEGEANPRSPIAA